MNQTGKQSADPWRRWAAEVKTALSQGWPTPTEKPQSIHWWRERVVSALLGLTLILGAIAYIPGMILSYTEGRVPIAIADTVALLCLIFLFFSKNVSYRVKAIAMVAAGMMLGLTLLVLVGFYGAGYLWLFSGCLLAGVIWGLPALLIVLGISLAALAAIGVALGHDLLWWGNVDNVLQKWLVVSSNFFLLVALLTGSFSIIIRGLQGSLIKEGQAREALETERTRLNAINNELINQIERRQEAENALGHSEKRYHELIESIFDTIYTHDLDGKILSINTIAANAMGYEPREIIGRPMQGFMTRQSCDHIEKLYLPRLKAFGQDMGTLEMVAKDGKAHLFEYRSSLVNSDSGVNYISGVARDVTLQRESQDQLKKLRDQLSQARKMEALGTLAGGIAHDFNNILSAIIGYSEMTLDNAREIDNQENVLFLNRVIEAAHRGRELVGQILTFSRRGSGERTPKRLQPILKECLAMLRATIPANVTIEADFKAPKAIIQCDATQIQQLLMNLCTNAAHAMEESGGLLNIAMSEVELPEATIAGDAESVGGRYARIVVIDQGTGIDADIADRVFDPFFTTKPDKKGSGMGLAVVHGIVKQHGGLIDFSSTAKGTTFEVMLPLSMDLETIDDQALPTALPGGNECIVFIDDEEPLVHIARSFLVKLGYRVHGFNDPKEAMAFMEANPGSPDMLITDQTMPGLTGLQISARVRRMRPGLPVILCTGFSNVVDKQRLDKAGVGQLLMKPVSRLNLAQTIRRLLDKDQPA